MKSITIFVALLMAAMPLQLSAAEKALNFRVYLDDKPIGYHRVTLNVDDENPANFHVSTQASFDVKILFLTAFTYEHEAQEQWRNSCLYTLKTTTNDNGNRLKVSAQYTTAGLVVDASDHQATLPGCVRTFAYWDKNLLQESQLLNTQNGHYDQTDFSFVSNEPLTFSGQDYGAERYKLTVNDEAPIFLWYSKSGEWQALQTTVKGGRQLLYLREVI